MLHKLDCLKFHLSVHFKPPYDTTIRNAQFALHIIKNISNYIKQYTKCTIFSGFCIVTKQGNCLK